MKKSIKLVALVAIAAFSLTSCALFQWHLEKFNQAWSGVDATMKTYTQEGKQIDEINGNSFRITRDEKFDSESSSSDGSSTKNKDSQVLLISLGKSHISHVGSTMILEENGLHDILEEADDSLRITNTEFGVPWINKLRENIQNDWSGKSKTILIRSQDGNPVATYTGNNVEVFPTDIPKSTWFRVDGKMLFVYRADYTVYDNDLVK